jgi:hypothetical protein
MYGLAGLLCAWKLKIVKLESEKGNALVVYLPDSTWDAVAVDSSGLNTSNSFTYSVPFQSCILQKLGLGLGLGAPKRALGHGVLEALGREV